MNETLKSRSIGRLGAFLERRGRTLGLVLAVLVLALAFVPLAGAQDTTGFQVLLDALSAASAVWTDLLLNRGLVFQIYGACIALEVAFLGYNIQFGSLKNQPMPWASIYRQLGIIAFAGFVLLAWPQLGGSVQGFFIGIATEATGLSSVSPEALAAPAVGIFSALMNPRFLLFYVALIPVFQIFLIVILLVMAFALASVGIRALLLVVESHLLMTVGPIPFALAAWSPTAALADHYLRYAARLGIEWMILYLILDMGTELGPFFETRLQSISAWQLTTLFMELFWMAVTAVAYAWAAIRLPSKFASEIVHLWRPGIAEGMKS